MASSSATLDSSVHTPLPVIADGDEEDEEDDDDEYVKPQDKENFESSLRQSERARVTKRKLAQRRAALIPLLIFCASMTSELGAGMTVWMSRFFFNAFLLKPILSSFFSL